MYKIVNGEQVELTQAEIDEMSTRAAEFEANRLDNWRANATLSRRQFCLACLQAGLLTSDDAVIAAKGEWPTSFDVALAGLTEFEVAAAKVEWASVSVIRRNAPLLATVQVFAGVTEEQLDALFGWA